MDLHKERTQVINKGLLFLALWAFCLMPLTSYSAPGDLLWPEQSLNGNVGSSVGLSPASDVLYVGTADNHLLALDITANGSELWRFETYNILGSSPAIADDGIVYVGSYDGTIYALDPAANDANRERWRFTTGDVVYSTPAISPDGTVYVGSSDHYIYAIDKATGQEKWHLLTGGDIGSSPAFGIDGTIYVGSEDGYLYALDSAPNPASREKWRFDAGIGEGGVSTPAISANGVVYVGSYNNKLYAVDAITGAAKWAVPTILGGRVVSSPAIGADGTIYVTSYDDASLNAIDPDDGTIKWSYPLGSTGAYSSPAIDVNGIVYVGSFDNKVIALNPSAYTGTTASLFYREIITDSSVISSPTIGSDGTVYVTSSKGTLYAIEGDSAGLGPWPMFGHDNVRSGNINGPVPSLSYLPTIEIISPENGASFPEGVNITFTGEANDPEDGDISNDIEWTSSLVQGPLATTNTFDIASLAAGEHTITASVTDTSGQTVTAEITLTITDAASNTPPTVSITGPAVTTYTVGDNVTFTGSATDTEDGTITSGLQWVSDQDGVIGSGGSFSTASLSQGTHTITASVTDSGGLTGNDTISVTINPVVTNDVPDVNITGPAVTTYTVGDNVTFTGTATDTEDGTITSGLQWVSDQDGVIGSGGSFSTASLSQGTHTITASVTDSGSLTGNDTISVTINPIVTNDAPVVNITGPSVTTFTVGDNIAFAGSATDTEDGTITSGLSWTSDQDGVIGSGGSFSTASLSQGTHTITASVTDSGGLTGNDTITVTINAAGGGSGGNTVVFSDDFETDQGWVVNPDTADTATTGMWERAVPDVTVDAGITMQLDAVSGTHVLATEAAMGATPAERDIDNGSTSIRSPDIVLPTLSPGEHLQISFSYNFAHNATSASADDYLKVTLAGLSGNTVIMDERGGSGARGGVWQPYHTQVDHHAGETVYLLIEAADEAGGTLVEAQIDDLMIEVITPTAPVFFDDFETDGGWTTNPSGTDTATTGMWEWANPEGTHSSGVKQLGTTVSGDKGLVTQALAGSGGGTYDIDGGLTSIRSPDIVLPSLSAGENLELSLYYSFAHTNNSSVDDEFRITLVGSSNTVLYESLGAASNNNGRWQELTVNLNSYAGQVVYLLIEASDNATGSIVEAQIDDVQIIKVGSGGGNTAPTVNITGPAVTTYTVGDNITFTGTATDTEDGTITSGLQWVSDQDGVIGNGGSFSTASLSQGTHTITASVTDSGGLTGNDTISATINPIVTNDVPVVNITGPAVTTYTVGDNITFTGTAMDTEDGTITSGLQWVSDQDGVIGNGGSFSTASLSQGTHTITASVTDSGGLTGNDTISVTINPIVTNDVPVVNITGPAVTTYTVGDNITFTGSATDTEDGTITSGLQWVSDQDGVIGSGGSFSTASLSQGTHTITASVTDSGSLTGNDTISVTINPIVTNDAPVVNITGPSVTTFTVGDNIAFAGSATDTEDGTITSGLSWTSDQDGVIGSGGSFSTSSLSVGTHTITASVTDSGSLTDSDTISVTINPVGGDNNIVFSDDFETDQGWAVNPNGTDTATIGLWERSDPAPVAYGGQKQLDDTVSGTHALITGPLVSGAGYGAYDIDDGVTSILSPDITLPVLSAGKSLELSFYFYFSHYHNQSSSDDYLRVTVVGTNNSTVVHEERGVNMDRDATWESRQVVLDDYAGETVSILIETADEGTGSLVDAGIDDVVIKEVTTPDIIYSDDFEDDQGWIVNPNSTDTATQGLWERGSPQPTQNYGVKQLGYTVSGTSALVTGLSASYTDVDGGITSVRSPSIVLPALTTGESLESHFYAYLAHTSSATSDDYLRVSLVGATSTTVLYETIGSAVVRDGVWRQQISNLNAYAGEQVYLLIEAADNGSDSLIEAAIDDMKIMKLN